MKATIKTQGQQFTITEGDILIVNRFPNTQSRRYGPDQQCPDGRRKALISTRVGKPTLAGASVSAKILENKRGDKVIVFKKRRSARRLRAEAEVTARSFP